MLKTLFGLTLSAMLFALCVSAGAQQPERVYRIGILTGGSASSAKRRIDSFRDGLRELGYVEGKNIVIEHRYAEGKRSRMGALAAELVRLEPDVIVAVATNAVLAVKQVTTTVPIVTPQVGDPVAAGLVASLARPGGNITGLTQWSPELSGKRLELLKESFPDVSRVAVFWNPNSPGSVLTFNGTEVAARALGLELQSVEVRKGDDFKKGFAAVIAQHANALVFVRAALTGFHQKGVLDFAVENRLPAMYDGKAVVEAGGLMSYGVDFDDLWRRSATYVDKILKGAKPGDLPIERPRKFELVINLKAAKQIGLTIPREVLYRADKVIK